MLSKKKKNTSNSTDTQFDNTKEVKETSPPQAMESLKEMNEIKMTNRKKNYRLSLINSRTNKEQKNDGI